MFQFSCRFAFY